MRHVTTFITAVVLLACAACAGLFGPSEPTIRLEGTVTAADDGSPVAGANIGVAFTTGFFSSTGVAGGQTDASGRYALSFETKGIGCKNYHVNVVANPLFLPILFGSGPGCTDRVQTFDFQLVRRTGG